MTDVDTNDTSLPAKTKAQVFAELLEQWVNDQYTLDEEYGTGDGEDDIRARKAEWQRRYAEAPGNA